MRCVSRASGKSLALSPRNSLPPPVFPARMRTGYSLRRDIQELKRHTVPGAQAIVSEGANPDGEARRQRRIDVVSPRRRFRRWRTAGRGRPPRDARRDRRQRTRRALCGGHTGRTGRDRRAHVSRRHRRPGAGARAWPELGQDEPRLVNAQWKALCEPFEEDRAFLLSDGPINIEVFLGEVISRGSRDDLRGHVEATPQRLEGTYLATRVHHP